VHDGVLHACKQQSDRWITAEETTGLKHGARRALQELRIFHTEYGIAEAEVLGKVAVMLVTTDVALKLYGRSGTPGSPAARLLQKTARMPHHG
jgi:hypothetical protein